jgi:hypothetical protein
VAASVGCLARTEHVWAVGQPLVLERLKEAICNGINRRRLDVKRTTCPVGVRVVRKPILGLETFRLQYTVSQYALIIAVDPNYTFFIALNISSPLHSGNPQSS